MCISGCECVYMHIQHMSGLAILAQDMGFLVDSQGAVLLHHPQLPGRKQNQQHSTSRESSKV